MEEPAKRIRSFAFDGWRFNVEEYAEAGTVNLISKTHNVNAGWVPHGGIWLKNVYHDGFRLAFDMGVISIYVFPGDRSISNTHVNPKRLILGPPDFVQVDDNDVVLPQTKTFDMNTTYSIDHPFSSLSAGQHVYQAELKGELKVRFRSNDPLFGWDSGYLWIDQIFQFSGYSDVPAHEPSGGLMAARVYPIIKIHYEHSEEDWVEMFKVDYRMHPSIDVYNRPALDVEPPVERVRGEYIVKNAAGVFADNNSGSISSVENATFYAAEKPLVYELITTVQIPHYDLPQKECWDNIHWWAFDRSLYSVHPSAPGAFHAMHIHWHWGKDIREGGWPRLTPHEGESQFTSGARFGYLMDSELDRQIISLAVLSHSRLIQDILYQSSPEFDEFILQGGAALPAAIEDGENLLLFYSVLIHPYSPTYHLQTFAHNIISGKLFVHGLFFAHESERNTFYTGRLGTFYKNTSNPSSDSSKKPKQEWYRYPKF